MATHHNQPDFFPRHIVERLRQDLASARKNIDKYEESSTYFCTIDGVLVDLPSFYIYIISCILIYCTAKHSE